MMTSYLPPMTGADAALGDRQEWNTAILLNPCPAAWGYILIYLSVANSPAAASRHRRLCPHLHGYCVSRGSNS